LLRQQQVIDFMRALVISCMAFELCTQYQYVYV